MASGDTTVEFARRCRHCGEVLSATSAFCSKCGATAETPGGGEDALRQQVQALFGEELDLEREIGRGGMAVVYAGYDPALQRRVAVKVLLPEIADDRSAADRFLREARTVAALQHPHVVTVYAVKSRDGVHAIVMQFVEGRSLDAVLRERQTLPVHVAGSLLAQAAEGLQHAHDRGVIHRDVKPANVLIDHDGRAIVSDFGIARRDSGPRTTETGLVIGTWAYMSPEQRSADSITAATDQYALGVMAFELLTGRLPFTGTPAEVLRAHLHDPPPSLRALRPEVSEAAERVVHRMMAKDADARFPSLREPQRAFRSLVPDEGKTTLQLAAYSRVGSAPGKSAVVAAVPPPARGATRKVPGRERSTAEGAASPAAPGVPAPTPAAPAPGLKGALVGAGLGVVALAAAWFALQGRGPGRGAEPATSGGDVAAATQTPVARDTTPADAPAGAADTAGAGAAVPAGVAQPGGRSPASGAPRTQVTAPQTAVDPGSRVAPAPLASNQPVTVPRANAGAMPASDSAAKVAAAPERAAAAPPRTDAGGVASGAAGGVTGGAAGGVASAAGSPAPGAAAAVADARRLGREFVTLLNQRRYREVAQIPHIGGDAAARAELLRLVESANDFAAGFDRVPSAPGEWVRGFETDFDLDVEWRGGRKLFRVRLFASPAEGGWRTVGIAVEPIG